MVGARYIVLSATAFFFLSKGWFVFLLRRVFRFVVFLRLRFFCRLTFVLICLACLLRLVSVAPFGPPVAPCPPVTSGLPVASGLPCPPPCVFVSPEAFQSGLIGRFLVVDLRIGVARSVLFLHLVSVGPAGFGIPTTVLLPFVW